MIYSGSNIAYAEIVHILGATEFTVDHVWIEHVSQWHADLCSFSIGLSASSGAGDDRIPQTLRPDVLGRTIDRLGILNTRGIGNCN